MQNSQIDHFLDELADASKARDAKSRVWDLTTGFFAQNGFDKVIYLDLRRDSLTMLTTMPPEWVARYQDRNYKKIDPFFAHCATTFRPVMTGVAYADKHANLSSVQTEMISEAAMFGMNAGFSSTIRLLGPQGMTGWNLGSSLARKDVDAIRCDRGVGLRLAAKYAHDILRQTQCDASLSPRERECLALLAQGMRTKDVAHSLNLSTAAVELYLRNARKKMGASTRDQAVAIAAMQGWLTD